MRLLALLFVAASMAYATPVLEARVSTPIYLYVPPFGSIMTNALCSKMDARYGMAFRHKSESISA